MTEQLKKIEGDPSQEKPETQLTYENLIELANSDENIAAYVNSLENIPEERCRLGEVQGYISQTEKYGLTFNCYGKGGWFRITRKLIDDGDVIFSRK